MSGVIQPSMITLTFKKTLTNDIKFILLHLLILQCKFYKMYMTHTILALPLK